MDQTIRDRQTTGLKGEERLDLPDGSWVREGNLLVDARGSLSEVIDERWDEISEPIVSGYFITHRPGIVKGWAVHQFHADRYFIVNGTIEVVLYDERPDSDTKGLVSKIYLTEQRRRMLYIPIGVWHASRNIGESESLMFNFPTVAYDYENPDKLRLPLDTDRIPHDFGNATGW